MESSLIAGGKATVYDKLKHRQGQQEVLTKTLTELFLAALLFTGGHFLLSAEPARARLVARLGEPRFLAAYSAIMFAAFAWLILRYIRAPYVMLWAPPGWARTLALAVMPVAFILLAGGLRPDNPTSVGALARAESQPPGFFAVTRHPFLWAATLWALAHIPANGDAASLILFGGILLLALPGTAALDAKLKRRHPEGFARLARATSNVPLAAVIAGRASFGARDFVAPVAIGLAAFLVLLYLHRWLFGVSPLPGQ